MLVGPTACGGDTSIPPPKASSDSSDARVAGATTTVDKLAEVLRSADRSAATSLGLAGSRDLLGAVAENVATLHIVDIGFRLVDDAAPAGTDDLEDYGPNAWRGTVDVEYRLRDWDVKPTQVETTFVFAPTDTGQAVVDIGGTEGRTPVWLTGPVTALSAGRTLVIDRSAGADRFLRLARKALVDVGRVLPDWHGKLVIEVPESEDGLERALGATAGQYANIAAVTASVDGSLVRSSPVHVFINPQVFAGLGRRGSQVVISHESTHVATGATFASMPTWLLEGFADYVALVHANIPVSTAASQILSRIRKDGPPDHLPTTAELDPSANGLGATYEEAWLATRFIGREYGEAKLVRFYYAVSDGTDVAHAFTTVLGTTEAAFVKQWRADLRDLAGGMAG
ncbi:hypothetical protein [Nocardioides marmorisolisilvae]|uniref:Uncharacterized protein n=1 Tax=Nocardioides marmorisolisilvae TaxID=1542737 RepID=A0A3N0DTX5_9ACTN|nr:hypothetical protein [Nocardioides marmorisolisilvae]RNL79077.1 hypothetical protein EFL95_08545 [Nocardioides marmorisolisilvae]